ncbi:AGAP000815-PA-like protein [Anopheles sinensis]|uniref:AGAP000815-PA-like protein n=1 Tax=Anopheles sinensis TaxID=74873 RepID=A0A084WA04_ANOSI|nr:AGAP000815-PA-like protein [Anopheles sinensis]
MNPGQSLCRLPYLGRSLCGYLRIRFLWRAPEVKHAKRKCYFKRQNESLPIPPNGSNVCRGFEPVVFGVISSERTLCVRLVSAAVGGVLR